jgi:hypothetical protein
MCQAGDVAIRRRDSRDEVVLGALLVLYRDAKDPDQVGALEGELRKRTVGIRVAVDRLPGQPDGNAATLTRTRPRQAGSIQMLR